jgi:hypothetical protein
VNVYPDDCDKTQYECQQISRDLKQIIRQETSHVRSIIHNSRYDISRSATINVAHSRTEREANQRDLDVSQGLLSKRCAKVVSRESNRSLQSIYARQSNAEK